MRHAPPASLLEDEVDQGQGLKRIVFLSDGVFAIALTLLALDIRVHESEGTSFRMALLSLGPSIAVYVLTFILLGIYWVGHHRSFRYIVRYDYVLVWLNLFFLLCIAFLPAPTAVLADYFWEPLAFVFYGVGLACTSIAGGLLWFYAGRHHGLVHGKTGMPTLRGSIRRSMATVVVAAASAALAFLSPLAAFALLIVYTVWRIVASIREIGW